MPVSHFHDLQYASQQASTLQKELLARMARAPKFVFTEEVIQFITTNQKALYASISVAFDAGYRDLPSDPMLIEWFSLYKKEYRGRSFFLIKRVGDATYKLRYAQYHNISGRLSAAFSDGYTKHTVDELGTSSFNLGHERPLSPLSLPNDNYTNDFLEQNSGFAFLCAMALHCKGVVARPPTPESLIISKLDKARAKSGKPPTTKDYVTIHIGYSIDQYGNRIEHIEGSGAHLKMHLRRAHMRNQAYGPNNSQHKLILIRETIVNYIPGVELEAQQYKVVP